MSHHCENQLRCDLLTFHDQFLLWSTRHWVSASVLMPTMPPLVREAYTVAGLPETPDDLHELLTIITTAALRAIHLKPPCSTSLSSDEAHFLTLMTAARCETRDADTISLFRHWLPPAAARLALAPSRRLVEATFAKLGSPRLPHAELWQQAPAMAFLSPDPGWSQVH